MAPHMYILPMWTVQQLIIPTTVLVMLEYQFTISLFPPLNEIVYPASAAIRSVSIYPIIGLCTHLYPPCDSCVRTIQQITLSTGISVLVIQDYYFTISLFLKPIDCSCLFTQQNQVCPNPWGFIIMFAVCLGCGNYFWQGMGQWNSEKSCIIIFYLEGVSICDCQSNFCSGSSLQNLGSIVMLLYQHLPNGFPP